MRFFPLSFRCNRKWPELRPTGDSKIRFCGDCAREVHLCEGREELERHAEAGHCVAITPDYERAAKQENQMVLGTPIEPSMLPRCEERD